MGARGPTGAAHSWTETPARVIGKISDVRGRETERGGAKKKESEADEHFNQRKSRAVRFVSLTIMIRRDNAYTVAGTKFQMSNNTPS